MNLTSARIKTPAATRPARPGSKSRRSERQYQPASAHKPNHSTAGDPQIQEFCDALAKRYHPRRITLFGSHATGNTHRNSDVDLLIELDRAESSLGMAAAMIGELRPKFSVDLLIRTPRQLRERLRQGDTFLADVIRTGKVVYEAPDR